MRERIMPEAVAARTSIAALLQELAQDGWDMDREIIIALTAGKYRVSQEEFSVHTSTSVDDVTTEGGTFRNTEPIVTVPTPAAPKTEEKDEPSPQRRGGK